MGYWNASPEGYSLQAESTGLVWGDAPADILDDALDQIVKTFEQDLGRKPTVAEIKAGLLFSLPHLELAHGNAPATTSVPGLPLNVATVQDEVDALDPEDFHDE